jgi:hypothetical protein
MVPTDVLEAMLPVIGCHHPKNMALTMFRGLRPGNHVSRYRVYDLSQTLTVSRGLCSLMYGVPPPHLVLEEYSHYLRNALGTRMVTYWLLNT